MGRRKSNHTQLTEREQEIMARLWERGPLFVREMLEQYPDPKPHFNTISTIVRIMEQKGFVAHETVGGAHRYHAVAQPDVFARRSLAQVISNFFNNSYKSAVSALVADEKISVSELKEIIEIMEKNNPPES